MIPIILVLTPIYRKICNHAEITDIPFSGFPFYYESKPIFFFRKHGTRVQPPRPFYTSILTNVINVMSELDLAESDVQEI